MFFPYSGNNNKCCIILLFWIILPFCLARLNQYTQYDLVLNDHQAKELWMMTQNSHGIDFLSPINQINQPVKVLVHSHRQNWFLNFLKTNGIKYHSEVVTSSPPISALSRSFGANDGEVSPDKIDFQHFYRHKTVNAFLRKMHHDHPASTKLVTIGQSYEERNMTVIKISTGYKSPKPTIFIDAGIHAREWAAPATAIYIIHQLLENPENHHMIQDVNWIILPVVNPDGYEYTWTTNRFWRKTRSKGSKCSGADPNRNFDIGFGGIGTSSDECSYLYHGKCAFSEVEAKHLKNYLLKKDVYLYLTLHSCGSYILYPWGYTSEYPSNWKEMDSLGHNVSDAIKAAGGPEYKVGSSANLLYPAAGGSDDWSLAYAGVEMSYTIELPCGGSRGFDLPESGILQVTQNFFEGLKVYHNYVKENGKIPY